MSIQGIFSNRSDIRNINTIDYHVRAGASNTEIETLVKINKHILLGKYPTAKLAMEATEGALVKAGVDNPVVRRNKLLKDKKAVFRGADFIPNTGVSSATDWILSSFVTTKNTNTYNNTRNNLAMAGCTVPLLTRLEISGPNQVWIKLKTVSSGETTGTPQSTGYTQIANNTLVYIPMSQFLFFKSDNPSVTVTSPSLVSTTLNIYNAYTEDLLDTITMSVRWTA